MSEAVILFGISKDTIHRLIKSGRIPAHNIGQRLTRVSILDLELLFTPVESPVETGEEKSDFEVGNCYTISEVRKKYKNLLLVTYTPIWKVKSTLSLMI